MHHCMSAATVTATDCHWQCMQASALRSGARMARDAFMSPLVVLAYLLGLVGGLAWRAVQVFVGTYQSATWEVRRAGAVADLNAAVLGAAVILLCTSRAAFTVAQDSTSRHAWLSQLSEKPGMACNTFNQDTFNGVNHHDPTFRCDPPPGYGHDIKPSPLLINADPYQNVQVVLDILGIYVECDAFSAAVRVQRLGNDTQLVLHTGRESIASALASVSAEFLAPPKDWRDWQYYLSEIWPNSGIERESEVSGKSNGPDSASLDAGACRDFSAGLGFPSNSGILRYVTTSNNVGLFLNYRGPIRAELAVCISQSSVWQTLTANGTGKLRGNQGAFCPINGNLSIVWPDYEPYLCAEGFDVSQGLDPMKARVDALRLVNKFAYFYPCSSYDELFGLYIAFAGVFATVVLGTGVLLFTDVVCPMLRFGCESWRPSMPPLLRLHASAAAVSPGSPAAGVDSFPSANKVAVAAKQGFQTWQGNFCCKDLVEVVLRCMASLVLGTTLSLIFVALPWHILSVGLDTRQCGSLEPPASVFSCQK